MRFLASAEICITQNLLYTENQHSSNYSGRDPNVCVDQVRAQLCASSGLRSAQAAERAHRGRLFRSDLAVERLELFIGTLLQLESAPRLLLGIPSLLEKLPPQGAQI